MQKKKILVLASTFPRWDTDTTPPFVYELEKRLTDDFDIHILAPHSKGAKKREIRKNLTIHRFQYFWPASLQKLCYEGGILPNIKKNRLLIFQGITLILFELIAAINISKKEKIDLIHAHWIIPQGIVSLMLKKMLSLPYLVTTHGGDIYGLQNNLLVSLKKSVLTNAENITVVSNAIREEIYKKIDHQLSINVVSMGVDKNLFNPNRLDPSLRDTYEANATLLLFVGRLVEKKGVEYLIRAMALIIKKSPSTKLIIIGEGTLQEELEALTHELNLAEHVHFLGPIQNNDLPKYYATADVFIGPSIVTKDGDTEGLGLTFVEASLCECIPIGSNIGGISDVIEDNKTGFLVKEKDPSDIAEKVLSLISNPRRMELMKQNARKETVKKYDWEIIAESYKKLYLS